MVASIFCDAPSVSVGTESTKQPAENEQLLMDESVKARELDIISVLLRKIKELGRASLSSELVIRHEEQSSLS